MQANTNQEQSAASSKVQEGQHLAEIRQGQKEQSVNSKRAKLVLELSKKDGIVSEAPQTNHLEIMKQLNGLAADFFANIKAGNFDELTRVTQKIRKTISGSEDPPIDELISTGLVPHILKFMEYEYFQHEQLVNECAWIITNIASCKQEHVRYILDLDATRKALNLLDHDSEEVKDSAVWILSNIVAESFANRDTLINMGIVSKIRDMLDHNANQEIFLGHLAWLMSNLCRGKPYAAFEKLEPLLPIIQFFVHNMKNDDVTNHTLWCLSYLSDGSSKQIKALLELNIASHVVQMMDNKDVLLRAPALRTAGNLVTDCDELTDVMIQNGVIAALAKLLDDPKPIIRKEACWTFSNILAGSHAHIQEVITYNNQAIIKKLFEMIYNDSMDISRESFFCLVNICSGGTRAHIQTLVENNLIETIVDTFKLNSDPAMILVALEALGDIIESGKGMSILDDNPYLVKFTQCDGYTTIENLQNLPEGKIHNAVTTFIDQYLEPLNS